MTTAELTVTPTPTPSLETIPPEFSRPIEWINYPYSTVNSYPDWMVVQVLAKMDYRFARFILSNSTVYTSNLQSSVGSMVDYYLPLVTYKSISRNTKTRALFPGFVFVAFNPLHLYQVKDYLRTSRCVYGFLETTNQPRLRSELAALQSQTTADRLTVTRGSSPENWPPDSRIRVVEGPMMGLEGKLEQTNRGKSTIIVVLHLFGCAVTTTIDAGLVELCE